MLKTRGVLAVLVLLAGCEDLSALLESVDEQQATCAENAYRGNLFIRETETSKSLNGTFADLVFDRSTQTATAEVYFRQLGYDTRIGADGQPYSTDCAYTGTMTVAPADIQDGLIVYRGQAQVVAERVMDGCIEGVQTVEVSLQADEACEGVEGTWVHDLQDSQDTGRGTLVSTERYPRSELGDVTDDTGEIVDDTGTVGEEEPLLSPQGCPLDTELIFSGPLSAQNGCQAVLNTRNFIDAEGNLTGNMWLTDIGDSCVLTEGVLAAMVGEGGLTRGTVEGIVTAYAGVQIVEGCEQMVDGWFRINEWDDEEFASFDLVRMH